MQSDKTTNDNSQHIIDCQFYAETGSLERFLRVIRVRGFNVDGMQLELTGDRYNASLNLSGERAIRNLQAQLEKLAESISIQVTRSEPVNRSVRECA